MRCRRRPSETTAATAGGGMKYSSSFAAFVLFSPQVTPFPALVGAVLGADGVTMVGFITVAGVAATEGSAAPGSGRRNWFVGTTFAEGRKAGAGASPDPTPARISSRSASASCAGAGAPVSAVLRFNPPAAAAAFLANMFASRWRSFLSAGLAFFAAVGDFLSPFLRFLPSVSSSSSSDCPA